VFWKRLSILTEGGMDPQLRSLFTRGGSTLHACLRWCTLSQASHADLTPRRVACGVFCQSLVCCGLLPADAFGASHPVPSAWQRLFCARPFQPLPCELPSEAQAALLQLLAVSMGCSLDVIRQDCEAVASVLQSFTVPCRETTRQPEIQPAEQTVAQRQLAVHHV